MPSPDMRDYVDLTVYDEDPQTLYQNAMTNMGSYVSDWVPREGSIEVLLMESMALPMAELLYAVNRLPDAMVEILMQMYDVYRDIGTQPNALLQFTVVDDAGYTIPVGTQAVLYITDGVAPVVFTTDNDLVIDAGSTTGTVTATGDRYTIDANGTPVDTGLAISTGGLEFITEITFESIVTPGAEQEDDADWIARGTQRLAQLSEALVLASQFQNAALEDVGVNRALAVDNWDGTSAAPGSVPGYVTMAVYGSGGPLSDDDKTALRTDLIARAQANLTVNVIDAVIETLDITTTIITDSDADPATVASAINDALRSYLSLDTWDWSTSVRFNNLLSVIAQAGGVAWVQSITQPTGDITYTTPIPLVQAGTVTVVANGTTYTFTAS